MANKKSILNKENKNSKNNLKQSDDGKTGFYPLMVGKNGVYPKGYTSGISQGTTLQNLLDVFNISSAEPRITVNIGTVSALALFVIPWVPNIIPSV